MRVWVQRAYINWLPMLAWMSCMFTDATVQTIEDIMQVDNDNTQTSALAHINDGARKRDAYGD